MAHGSGPTIESGRYLRSKHRLTGAAFKHFQLNFTQEDWHEVWLLQCQPLWPSLV